MSFDWPNFLNSHHIDYLTAGANVAKGNIVIHCPYCGSADNSHHMSISLDGKGWRCWRKPEDHRGKNPARLVQALLGCSWQHAAAITGTNIHLDSDWNSRVHQLINPTLAAPRQAIHLPKEFHPFKFKNLNVVNRPYVDYLRKRGIDWQELTRRYQIYYATQGPWKGRIIFAVYYNEQLIGWTGRTIYPNRQPRYLSLTTNADTAKLLGVDPAVGPLPNYILWYDHLRKSTAHTVCICEGPFDALKVRILGRNLGITATCLFHAEPTPSQLDSLHDILPRFERRISLLDANTLPAAIRMTQDLAGLGVEVVTLPSGLKDPGQIDHPGQLKNLIDHREQISLTS